MDNILRRYRIYKDAARLRKILSLRTGSGLKKIGYIESPSDSAEAKIEVITDQSCADFKSPGLDAIFSNMLQVAVKKLDSSTTHSQLTYNKNWVQNQFENNENIDET